VAEDFQNHRNIVYYFYFYYIQPNVYHLIVKYLGLLCHTPDILVLLGVDLINTPLKCVVYFLAKCIMSIFDSGFLGCKEIIFFSS